MILTTAFEKFFASEKSGGILLLLCTSLSLLVTNLDLGFDYPGFWHLKVAGLSLEQWINDGLMAIFFLLIGLELERELYVGELSTWQASLLPGLAALGGMAVPAGIHYLFNGGTPFQHGIGIPMATDIAFALGVLAILGDRIPPALKVFVVAFAVIDDLGAILLIAFFYTAHLSLPYLIAALLVFAVLLVCNFKFRIMSLAPYLLGGLVMWFFLLKSGVHATLAGVLLAFAVPFRALRYDQQSPSERLLDLLHKPVPFLILPIFALANTAIIIGSGAVSNLVHSNSLGIVAGLCLGKPLGVTLFCVLAVFTGLSRLPQEVSWHHILGAGILGGIGFTMSIFITNLAFGNEQELVTISKMAVLIGSAFAGLAGFLWLRFLSSAEGGR